MKDKSALAALAVMVLVGAGVQAQENRPENAAEQAIRTANVPSPVMNDQQIYRWVKIDCDGLKKCIEATKSRVSSTELKTHLERMEADHKALEETVKTKYAKFTEVSKGEGKVGALVNDNAASRDARLVYKPCDFVEVKRQVCEKMKSLAEKEMANLKSEDFDRAVAKHLCIAHEGAIASIDAVQGSASTELNECLTKAKETLTAHLDECKKICKAHESTRTAN